MLTIEVFGLPAPQGSKRVFNGRVVEASAKTLKPWRKAVSVACHNLQLDELLTGPVKVEVRIFLPRPKTVTIKKRFLPIVPPDVDKLCRSILDGIGQNIAGDTSKDSHVWVDDSQVVELHAYKFYADERQPGCTIIITPL
jgi:Holliday junction resolvase RusA-like endonuclease